MKLLLTGGSSLLGAEFLRHAPADWEIVTTVHRNRCIPAYGPNRRVVNLDVANREAVQSLLQLFRPEAIVHLSSLGNLDYCKTYPEEAWKVNVEGTRHLLEFSQAAKPVFLFASTMYVFDGTNPPYDEEAATNPISEYGRMKLQAEELVLQMSAQPVIFRLMTMYGWHSPNQRRNWVTWLLEKLENGENVPAVDDVRNNYVWVGDASQSIRAALERNIEGIFHIGGPEVASRYEFSLKIAGIFGLDSRLITRVPSEYFSGLAQRPSNSTCSIGKMRKDLGVTPIDLRAGLEKMKASMQERVSAQHVSAAE